MRDIKILIISDDPILNSALANSIEGQVFQWKENVHVFDPHGEVKFQHMNMDDTMIKQRAGECIVEITTMCVNAPSAVPVKMPETKLTTDELIALLRQGTPVITPSQPTEPKTDGDHHH